MSIAEDERRSYSRYSREPTPCEVTLRTERQSGMVIEESIGGIRVAGLSFRKLHFNEEIFVEFDGDQVNGCCRNISRDDDGTFSVGIKNGNEPLSNKLLLACFLKHQDQSFSCNLIAECGDKVNVGLIDGKQFVISAELVEYKTQPERTRQLNEDKALTDLLAKLYQIRRKTDIPPDQSLGTAIAEYEFSGEQFAN